MVLPSDVGHNIETCSALGRIVVRFWLLTSLAFFGTLMGCSIDDTINGLIGADSAEKHKIVGTIDGIGASPVTIRDNKGNQIVINQDGSFELPSSYEDGDSFVVTIDDVGSGQACSLANGSGIISGDVLNIQISCNSFALSAAYPTNGANWMDWVDHDGDSRYNALDTACNATTDTECWHGGELKKGTLTGYTSCDGLSFSDNLGVFDWVCDVPSGTAVVYSKGLKYNRGLVDLIDSGAFKQMQLTVTKSSSMVAKTALGAWWTNPIKAAPDNSGGADSIITLDSPSFDPGDIVVVNATTQTQGYILGEHQLALVVMPSQTLAMATATTPSNLIQTSNFNFVWLEGAYDCQGASDDADNGLAFSTTRFSMVRNASVDNCTFQGIGAGDYDKGFILNSSVTNSGDQGVYLLNSTLTELGHLTLSAMTKRGLRVEGADFAYIHDIYTHSNTDQGIELQGITDSKFFRIYAANNGDSGIGGGGVADVRNVYHQVFLYNNGFEGIGVGGIDNAITQVVTSGNSGHGHAISDQNSILHGTSTNNGGSGYILYDAQQSILANHLSASNSGRGFYIRTNSTNNYLYDSMAVNNLSYGVEIIHPGTITNTFHFGLWVGNNMTAPATDECNIVAGNNLDSGVNGCTTSDGLLTITQGADGSTLFRGQVLSDSSNSHIGSLDGSGYLSLASLTDWVQFDSMFRAWGMGTDQSWLLTTDAQCIGGGVDCAIYDWRLDSADTQALGQHGTFQPGQACPADATGNDAIVDSMTSANTYLSHAVEIVEDNIGDDDGLCESGDACIYTPNVGAYQGSGDYLSQGTCTFLDGTITGVKLYAYPNQ